MSTFKRMTVEQFREEAARQLTEDAWQAIVISQAKARGWRVYHTFDSRRSTAGYPDLTLVRPPRVLFVELKTAAGRLTPAQLDWIGDLRHCHGVEAHVWRPGDSYLETLR